MARAALAWGVLELAKGAHVSTQTIVRFERGEQLRPATLEAIINALEAAGIEFIPENGGGVGVRFRIRQKPTNAEIVLRQSALGTLVRRVVNPVDTWDMRLAEPA